MCLHRADYVPLLDPDGAAIPNFSLNSEAVEGLNYWISAQAINVLFTDLGVDFQGRTLAKNMVFFLHEIRVKTIYKG
ncbi:hypothetical protein F52700_4848 [Fusarium sp. NRRL 52700]|nr:hypothetical protein F52700_4848 [Fusarium sp. NRRL 52700]